MRFIRSLQQKRRLTIALTLACMFLVGAVVLRSAASRRLRTTAADFHSSPSAAQIKQDFREQMQRGLGGKIRFADAKAGSKQVQGTVEATAGFITERSGFSMSDETMKRFVAAEQKTLTGRTSRLAPTDLAAVLTAATVDQVSSLTDEKITRMAKAWAGQGLSLRANGELFLSQEQFTPQVKSLRDQLASGNIAAQEAVRAVIESEVKSRVSTLSDAAPEQFGHAADGLTPLQSFLIAYSVVMDDSLAGSQEDLGRTIETLPRAAVKAQKNRKDGKTVRAFGPNGLIFTSPASAVFNKKMVDDLLSRFEKGGNGR